MVLVELYLKEQNVLKIYSVNVYKELKNKVFNKSVAHIYIFKLVTILRVKLAGADYGFWPEGF